MSGSDNPITPPTTPAEVSDAKKPDGEIVPETNLTRLAKATEEAAKDLNAEQQKVLSLLEDLQKDHIGLEEEYRVEWNLLKKKYQGKFDPLYSARLHVLTTGALPSQGSAAPVPPTDEGGKVKLAVPDFWMTVMRNHGMLAEMIEPNDCPILSHLMNISFDWEDPKEQTSFTLEFQFSANEFFENEILKKSYLLERAEDDDEGSVLTKAEGTTINWKPGKNVTEKTISHKQRNKRTNQTRTVTETVEENSFFNFFQTHNIPSESELETMSDQAIAELEMVVEAEFEVGCILRDKIIPRAFGWFLGIERDDDDETDSQSGADDFDEDDEDDE